MKDYSLAGFKLTSPIVAAAGFQNGDEENLIKDKFLELLDTEVGAITLGSFTILPRGGNLAQFGPPVYYYDAKAGMTYNSMGLANIGEDRARDLLPWFLEQAKAKNKIVIHSVSRSIEEELGDAVAQCIKLTRDFLKAGAQLVEINLSTPNTVTKDGGRAPIMGLDPATVKELAEKIAGINGLKKVGLKMPPYLSQNEKKLVPALARTINNLGLGFVTVCNTIPNQIAKNYYGEPVLSVPGGAAGLSGPATKNIGRAQLKLWRKYLSPKIDIISLLGVDAKEEVETRLKLGAAAAGGVSFFRESLPLLKEIKNAGQARQKIILAIDTSDKSEAEKLLQLAAGSGAKYVKLGLELSSAAGWSFCSRLAKKYSLDWVADAKLDDIPNTVKKTVLNLKNLPHPPIGITMHVTAGADTMRLAQAAAGDIMMLGVTILTSMPDKEAKAIYGVAPRKKVVELAEYAAGSGLKGIVASPQEIGHIKHNPKTRPLFAMIPGVRSASASQDDQSRVGTPVQALKAGADLLVIGRQVTQADNPAEAYNQLLREIEGNAG